MAERRMFAKAIIDSDAFLEMSASAQSLYFHLAMRADDEGFVNNPKRIQRMVGSADDDLRVLIAKRYVLAFESGVIVIKHWKIHNYIQNDRYKPTMYQEERRLLVVKPNKSYTEAGMDTECIQDVSNMYAQVSIGKVSIDKSSRSSNVGGFLSESEMLSLSSDLNVTYDLALSIGIPDTQHDRDSCDRLVSEYTALWVQEAITRTGDAAKGARSWRYIEAILKRWRTAGGMDDRERASPDADVVVAKTIFYRGDGD